MMDNNKKRILVIEDDEEMRSLLKDFLLEEGFEPDSVNNGSEAFRRVVKEPFDLIITDHHRYSDARLNRVGYPTRVEEASARSFDHRHYGLWERRSFSQVT